jgi:hypothetical protein
MVPESSDPLRRVTLLMLVTSDVFPRARTTDIKSSRRQGSPHAPKQFLVRMGTVKDVETARALITYTAPNEPLSIYGRWDLGFGTTPRPKSIPDGAIDAKAMTASMTRYVRNLRGRLDMNRPRQFFIPLHLERIAVEEPEAPQRPEHRHRDVAVLARLYPLNFPSPLAGGEGEVRVCRNPPRSP